ncbi:MAG: N-acetylmuramoyl-L-alanine amidase [Bacteroidetes bacterium]|nr:N-acetylmuramoyl-L-alanine amidase [Bacteroidota bacterium]
MYFITIFFKQIRYQLGIIVLIFLNLSINHNGYSQIEEKYSLKTVVIDPGHGGKDSGARGRKSKEKDIVLDISLKLGTYIEENIPDVKVIYTRTTDVFVPLDERADIANKNKADLFISIHCNGNKDARAYGTETFAMGLHKSDGNLEVAKMENSAILFEEDYTTKYEGFDPHSAESYIIFSFLQNTYLEQSLNYAAHVENEFETRALRKSRGVKQAGFLVLWKTTMPSVLVETGFITNPSEERFLMSTSGQEYIASAIYRAFKSYKSAIEAKSKFVAKVDSSRLRKDSITENEINENTTGSVKFKVQIASSSNSVPIDSDFFKGFENVEEFKINELYKYTVGSTSSFEKIVQFKKIVEEKFPDAFIIAVDESNNIIPLNEALEKLKM